MVTLPTIAMVGCATAPEELREAHAASLEAVERYGENAEEAISALLSGYREASRREFRHVAADQLEARAARVTHFDAEGRLVEEPLLTPAQAGAALDSYRDGLDRIETEVRRFLVGWDEAALDAEGAPIVDEHGSPVVIHHPGWDEAAGELREALALQDTVRIWLSREGIEPDRIDALARGLAEELERRGKR